MKMRYAILAALVGWMLAGCGGGAGLGTYDPDGSGNGGLPDATTGADGLVTADGAGSGDGGPAGTDATADGMTPPRDTDGGGPPADVPWPDDATAPVDVPVGPKELYVVSAFSADGATITVRFNRPIDAASGADAGNYEFLQGTAPVSGFASATVDGAFAKLTLPTGTDIDPDYTYRVRVTAVVADDGEPLDARRNQAVVRRSVYLAIVWHQHQPLYVDSLKDELQGPWVRKHATKDYYDMAAVVESYPDVHLTINLTIVMLNQLERYYLERLGPYVDVANNRVDEAAFLARWRGKTDPWVDLLLDDTPAPGALTEKQRGLLYADPWSCVSTHPSVLARFPEYERVRFMNPAERTQDDLRMLKIMFEFAWFDPSFLDGPVTLPDGSVVDLSDLIGKGGDGKYRLAVPASEEMANRLVAEEYKIMANVVAIHQRLRYVPDTYEGQIEIATTPFYHPILPLVFDTSLASVASPGMPLPDPRYAYPEDARAQVLRAVGYYERVFGEPPRGMWPGEGSVAEDVVDIFVSEGIELTWVGTGQEVLQCSTPGGQPHWVPYRVDADDVPGDGGDASDEMVVVFRDPILSDKMGFKFQSYEPQDAVNEFVADVLGQAPRFGAPDRLITVILDGENAWESYTRDHDAKNFFRILYSTLDRSSRDGEIVTITPTEYVTGNPRRGIPAHPVHQQTELEPLWAGSWIAWEKSDADPCANFEVWVGESEENTAWEYLARARADLAASGLTAPNPRHEEPAFEADELLWYTWKAFDEIYAAEGSDWFWWYGTDMITPSNNDSPFDIAFRAHLSGMYQYMNDALAQLGREPIAAPDFAPIIQERPLAPEGPFTTPPTVDGELRPNKTEWLEEGGSFSDRDSGAMHNPNDDVGELYYGYTEDAFYLALVSVESFADKVGHPYDVTLYFSQKDVTNPTEGTYTELPSNGTTAGGHPLEFKDDGATWRLQLDFSGGALVHRLMRANGSGGWAAVANDGIAIGGPVGTGQILELRIPFADLGSTGLDDPLEFMVAVTEDGQEIDYAPNTNFGSYVVLEDATALVYVTFAVDVSGPANELEAYTDLCLLPSEGATVFIAGNRPAIGLAGEDWIPNKIPLNDSGTQGDETAGDQVWSLRAQFTRGFWVQWKYSIGRPDNEGDWYCTEEFPVTYRGWVIPEIENLARVTITDVFANKPTGGIDGRLGSETVLRCEDRQGNVISPCE